MLLNELFEERLDEGPWKDALKRLAVAGTLATGIGTGGIGAYNSLKAPEPTQTVATMPQAQQTSIAVREPSQKAEKTINQNFPKELLSTASMQPNERVQTFVKTVLPLVVAENNKISEDRKRLKHDIQILERGGKLSKEESAWLKSMVEKYGEDNSLKVKEIREKGKQTCIEKYGKEHISQVDDIKLIKKE